MSNNPLTHLYEAYFGYPPAHTEPITGSGSSRRYYRFRDNEGNTVIGVEGTDLEENVAFIALSRHFEARQLPVPHIICVSDDGMCYLQTDVGSESLFDLLADGRAHDGHYSDEEVKWLHKAMQLLPKVQFLGARDMDWQWCYPMPTFDREGMMYDLNYFKYCFLRLYGVECNDVKLQKDFHKLIDHLQVSDEECGFMYRDFQARNIIISDSGTLSLIDFQGGRRGALYYDLASFLWQASAKYPEILRRQLLTTYRNEACLYTTLPEEETFCQRLEQYVFFRMLQVMGAYGYRGLYQRKQYFLNSIQPALKQVKILVQQQKDRYPYLCKVIEQIACTQHREGDVVDGKAHSCSPVSTPQTSSSTLKTSPLVITVWSFSYKKGIPEDTSGNGGGYVFDCRGSHNPGRYEEYKQMTGLDAPVIRFIEDDGEVPTFLTHVYQLADTHVQRYIERGFTSLMFAFGCTGGQHRSVYCAQHLAEYLHRKYNITVYLHHREQHIDTTFIPQ